ncbi:RHS repeat-associated core domain-containing protein, partial [Pseudoalteromonas sp. L7]
TPFGEKVKNTTDPQNDQWFTGKRFDTKTGLSYMQARYYDPVIGRFYSNDPLDAMGHLSKGDIHGFNRYAYANNNPYKYTDPDGLDAYLVSRPLSFTSKANHNFIVYNATSIGDPNATVRSFGDVGNDTMGEVTANTEGFSEGTLQSDTAAWQGLSSEGSTVTYRKIDASDAKVAGIADSVKGGQEYSAVPELQGGVNSNSAAGAIAHKADGGSPSVNNGVRQPGASKHDKVEFKEENR